MAALAAAVHPFAGVVPRGAAPAPSDASKRASGKKPQRVVAPARDTSVCLAGGVEELYLPSQKRKMMTCNRNNVFETAHTAAANTDTKVLTVDGGEMSARELLQKRLASELDLLRGLLKTAELISRRAGACKGGGAPTAGKKEQLLASKQRPEPMVDGGGGNTPPVKRRKISALVEQKQKQKRVRAPRMSPEERSQLAGRVSSLSEELPGHIAEFLLEHFGDADSHGEIEIDFDSAEDSVLFELKAQLDKFAQERRPIAVDVILPEEKGEKIAVESKSKGILEKEVQTGSRPSSRSGSGSDKGSSYSDRKSGSDDLPALREAPPEQIIATPAQPPSSEPPASVAAAQSSEAKKIQDAAPKAVSLAGLIYRAKVRRELLEMERAALPDESIHPWDLQRLGITEYGRPSIMRQLGLFLKPDDA